MVKPNKSFRIDPDLLERAQKIGLPIVAIFEDALSKALDSNKCPTCGQEIKKDKKEKKK